MDIHNTKGTTSKMLVSFELFVKVKHDVVVSGESMEQGKLQVTY